MGQLQQQFGCWRLLPSPKWEHHPLLPMLLINWEGSQRWRSRHGSRVHASKRKIRMEKARGEASCIDWCVKGLSGAPLLRDSPERRGAGINNCSIGALFALLARSRRTLVAAYHPAESPRNAVIGKCACSHDIY